jgi:hypothetical protein
MLKEGRKIVYLDDAVVYDEKIQNRKFWKSTPQMAVCTIALFQKDILTASKHLVLKGNIDYFDKAINLFNRPAYYFFAVILSSCVFIPNYF